MKVGLIVLRFCLLLFLSAAWVGCADPAAPPPAAPDSPGSENPSPTPPVSDNRSWSVLGPAGFTPAGVRNPSLAVDPEGTVYVAYNDGGNGDAVTVQRFNGTAWEPVGSVAFNSFVAPRLSFDPSGSPAVMFLTPPDALKASTLRFDGQNWQSVGETDFTPDRAFVTSLASGGDRLYSASGMSDVTVPGHPGNPKIFQHNGTTWTPLTPSPADLLESLKFHHWESLAVDGVGTPYIVAADRSVNDKATVMKWTGTNWNLVGPAGFSLGGGTNGDFSVYQPSLAFDSSNRPYVGYIQDSTQPEPRVSVMKFDGVNWSLLGGAGISPAIVEWTILVVDSFDIPFVSYIHTGANDFDPPYPVSVLKFQDSTWVGTGSDGDATLGLSDDAFGTSFVKGPAGVLYLAFPDHAADDKLTVMRYQ